jgi:DNA-binding NarL/FixJ family response regulator
MRILLADDHAIVRGGVRLLLAQIEPGSEVFEAADGREAVVVAAREQPDLGLIDISMPGLNGLDALPRLLDAAPRMRLLVLSMHTAREYVQQALRAGAHGYLVKDSAVDELAEAIAALRQRRPYLSRVLADALLTDYVRDHGGASATPAPAPGPAALAQLTPRQREVLRLIAEGRSTREMADALNLSIKTVETHRAELMRRLGIHEVAGLTRYAIRHGIVSPHD